MTSNSVLSDSPALRGYWYAVAESTQLDQVPVHVRLLGDDYVLYRPDGGSVVAAPDRCPHREAPLSLGRMEQGCLVCCYHGWTFGDNGRVRSRSVVGERRPHTPEEPPRDRARHRALRTRVDLPR